MNSESADDDPSFRIISRVYPTSTETLKGLQDEPLVVRQEWPGGRVDTVRIVNPERSYQIPTLSFRHTLIHLNLSPRTDIQKKNCLTLFCHSWKK